MTDAAKSFVAAIQTAARKKQSRILKGLVGKYVRRNNVTYLVVAVNKKSVELSNVDTAVKQTWKLSTKAFLSRKITVLERGVK